MSFKEVQSLDADNAIALGGVNRKTGKKNATSAEGYFLGTRKVESKKSRDGYANLHFLQTPSGNLGVWGKTDMDRKLSTVTPGTMIRISHTGMQATPNGEMYKFKVEVDADNTIEVTTLTAGAANEDFTEGSTEETETYSDDSEDEDAAQAAALLVAERKAKVQAVINKNKTK